VLRNKNAKKATATSDQPSTGSKRPPPPFEVTKLNEVYFKDKVVSRFTEFAEGEFAVCIAKDEYVYLISRKKQAVTHKVRNPQGKSCNYEVLPIPAFDLRSLPFLLVRDDKCLMLLNIKEGKFLKLHQAKYESSQCYKGMQLVVSEESTSTFSLFLLSHKPDLSSKMIKLDFDESFVHNLSGYSSRIL